jgi:hypothetical protein
MRIATIKKSVSIILLICFCGKVVYATQDPPVLQVLNGTSIKVDSFRTVEDAKFFDPAYAGKLNPGYLVKNRVSFKINEGSNYYLQSSFSATVTVWIISTRANNTKDSISKTLTINYNPASLYTNTKTYVFTSAYRVTVRVISVSSNVGWDVWPALSVENELTSFPSYKFYCDTNAIQSVNHASLPSNTKADQLPVDWAYSIGADEYDLEWAYVDSSALKDGVYGDSTSPNRALIFDNNASRVTITTNSYNIPLIYDGKGTLFFRVRSVQNQPGGGRTESNWSSSYTNGLGRFEYVGHERAMNWQSTTSFAEEGKRKTVVQYFDGSLRNRQTVTKDNTTNNTIVAESIYDYQGRPVIQVMPAPTLNNVLHYSKNFNLGVNGEYNKEEFDSLPNPSEYCDFRAGAMSSDSGAARYYSPNNPEVNTGFNKFIPNAHGFPFSQVEYTPDNTGRVNRQGGVDSTFQLGSGHETKYYYGTPDQNELDALFGTEVGHYSHYFKTMVRDGNGQYSVSYADMHGRTIATALAGKPTAKLDTLVSNVSSTITETIADSASAVIKDLSIESKKGLLVPVAGNHTFKYQLSAESLQMQGCQQLICYDCLYDLRITITDDCNNQKLGGQPFDTTVHNFSLSSIDTSCANPAGAFSFTFTKFLQEGSYEITKTLTVSKAGMDFYRDSVFMKKNSCRTLESFIQEQRLIYQSFPGVSSHLSELQPEYRYLGHVQTALHDCGWN